MDIPFVTGYYIDEVKEASAVECTNLVPELPGTDKQKYRRTAGVSLFTTAGTKLSRGAWVMDDIAYEVAGSNLYRINSDGTNTDLGSITGSGRVSMADNGTQLCIVVPGDTGYIYTVSGGLVTISDTDYTANPSYQVAFIDGYFVHVTPDKLFSSDLNDGTSYNALYFADAESKPDKITSVHVSRNQLYIGGVETTEPFSNVGGADFPFRRIPGAVMPIGVKAKFSLVEFARTFAFVGNGRDELPAVYLVTSATPQRISTNAIDAKIQELTDSEREDIFCTSYAEGGGFFLNVHLKNNTFTYDSSTGLWHERTSKDVNGLQTNWRVNNIMTAYGKTLVTDNQSGRVGEMSTDFYKEYDDSVKRVFSTIPFKSLDSRLSISYMQLYCKAGTGNSDDAEPTVMREFSDDGGYTWSNQTSRSLGKEGERNKRQVWRREGQTKQHRVYKFTHDSPTDFAVMNLSAEFA